MIKIKTILIGGFLAGFCAGIGLSFAHPFGNPRAQRGSPGDLLAGAQIPEPLRELVQTKCGNCHSEAVEWPFYSRIAPVSWLIEKDVSEARAQMNFSRWDAYSNQEKMDLLSRLAAKARSGEMPPARYAAIHRDSKLVPEERDALYEWARAERKRLKGDAQVSSSGQ